MAEAATGTDTEANACVRRTFLLICRRIVRALAEVAFGAEGGCFGVAPNAELDGCETGGRCGGAFDFRAFECCRMRCRIWDVVCPNPIHVLARQDI